MYSSCLVSVVHFGLFHHFWGVFEVFVTAFYRRSQGWTELFRKPCTTRLFSHWKLNRCSNFPSNAKDSPFVPFSGQLGKVFLLSSPIQTIFVSLLELSTFCHTLWPYFWLRHSWKSTLATALAWQLLLTRWVHSQTFPLKYITLSRHLRGSILMPHCNVRPLVLISNCAVVERMVTRCGGKLKAPEVKQKSFKLERKVGRFFQADPKRGQMDYPSLCWRGKLCSGFEFRREKGLVQQCFRNSSVQPWLHL